MGEMCSYLGEIWYNLIRIANILSLADVSKHFCMQYDSVNEQAFLVEKPSGTIKHFFILLNTIQLNDY